jgi:3-oxoacyl-[acyl-carrier protein] reductase
VEGVGDPLSGQLALNLESPLRLVRALLRARCLASEASLLFISSNLARHAVPNTVAYSAAKAGLEGAVRALARELGPGGVRVNAIAPGLIATDMIADRDPGDLDAYVKEVPLGRLGEPSDVADVARYFLSPRSAFVSGQILDVDGGWGL